MSLNRGRAAVRFDTYWVSIDDLVSVRVHLGQTNEISSFDVLLINSNKQFSPGETNEIVPGDSALLQVGRVGAYPTVLYGEVEDVRYFSGPKAHYARVKGRCKGQQFFRRVVTETYENKKGEYIVKDLIDSYTSLSHVRDTTELIEDTDTTYTKLEFENTPLFDILKYIAETADKAGAIGFDFRIAPDGKFEFFARNSKTSSTSLSDRIEESEYRKDISRIRNKIWVFGAAEKAQPEDKDAWTETLDIDSTPPDEWQSGTGSGAVSLDSTEEVVGTYCIKHSTTSDDYYGCLVLNLSGAGINVNCNKYQTLTFQIKLADPDFTGGVCVQLEEYHDGSNQIARREFTLDPEGDWSLQTFRVGEKYRDEWSYSVANTKEFDWRYVCRIKFFCDFNGTAQGDFYVDGLFFNACRWEDLEENSGSQTSYGLREKVEVDEELHSDEECELRAKALVDHLKDPAVYLRLRSTVIDYGSDPLLPADKIHVTLPNENVDDDFRIISVEYYVHCLRQELDITMELGKESPLLADYLYAVKKRARASARYKIAR